MFYNISLSFSAVVSGDTCFEKGVSSITMTRTCFVFVTWIEPQQSIFANMSTKVLRIFFFNFGRLKQPKSKNLRVKDFTDSVSEQFPLVWNPLQQGE